MGYQNKKLMVKGLYETMKGWKARFFFHIATVDSKMKLILSMSQYYRKHKMSHTRQHQKFHSTISMKKPAENFNK